ncbi:hypothetical protein GCM10020367_22730 [Streptomyces sannanensis]|uniref:Uncharacterized protein n=1 Tax=Streptomyces sannanensis TaxID=285536 RepID=A0ABP6S9W3_9ACTN
MQRKTRGLAVMGGVLALAMAGGGVYVLTSDDDSPVAGETKGYKLTPAGTVGPYKRQKEYYAEEDLNNKDCDWNSDSDCGLIENELSYPESDEAKEIGIAYPAAKAGAEYRYRYLLKGRQQRKTLLLSGYWGRVDDPDKAIDNFFQSIKDGDQSSFKGRLVGTAEEVHPKGFDGALMKCQNAELRRMGTVKAGNPPKTMRVPVCVWADYSSVAATAGVDSPQLVARARGLSRSEVANLAAELYNTSRTKR